MRCELQCSERTTAIGITVATAGTNSLDIEIGMSTRGFADLMASRDTVAINIVFMIQEVLGVEVITEKQMVEACKNYITYLFSKHD